MARSVLEQAIALSLETALQEQETRRVAAANANPHVNANPNANASASASTNVNLNASNAAAASAVAVAVPAARAVTLPTRAPQPKPLFNSSIQPSLQPMQTPPPPPPSSLQTQVASISTATAAPAQFNPSPAVLTPVLTPVTSAAPQPSKPVVLSKQDQEVQQIQLLSQQIDHLNATIKDKSAELDRKLDLVGKWEKICATRKALLDAKSSSLDFNRRNMTIEDPADAKLKRDSSKESKDTAWRGTLGLQGCGEEFIRKRNFEYQLALDEYNFYVKHYNEQERKFRAAKVVFEKAEREYNQCKKEYEELNNTYWACRMDYAKGLDAYNALKARLADRVAQKEKLEADVKRRLALEQEETAKKQLLKLKDEVKFHQVVLAGIIKKHRENKIYAEAYFPLRDAFQALKEELEFLQKMDLALPESQDLPSAPAGISFEQVKLKTYEELSSKLENLILEARKITESLNENLASAKREIVHLERLALAVKDLNYGHLAESQELQQLMEADITGDGREAGIGKIEKCLSVYLRFIDEVTAALPKPSSSAPGPSASTATTAAVGAMPASPNDPAGTGPKPSSDGGQPPAVVLLVSDSQPSPAEVRAEEALKVAAREEEKRKQQEYFHRVRAYLQQKREEDKQKKERERKERMERARIEAERQRQIDHERALERQRVETLRRQEEAQREEQEALERQQQASSYRLQYRYA
jgi:hypothetical protein